MRRSMMMVLSACIMVLCEGLQHGGLLLFPSSATLHHHPITARQTRQTKMMMMTRESGLTKASLHFGFPGVPYAAGVHHIHSPEHIADTHKLGAPFFKIESVDKPRNKDTDKVSIAFTCSTLFIKNMRVRLFSSQPNESNLLFFKDGCALYGAKFTVTPTKAFLSHRLRLDVCFFSGNSMYRTTLKRLLPMFMFINGMEDRLALAASRHEATTGGRRRSDDAKQAPKNEGEEKKTEHPHFTEYRRLVLRGANKDEFWSMAERIMREYSTSLP